MRNYLTSLVPLPAFGKNVTEVNERQVGIVFALDAVGIGSSCRS
jgi:hypothetical protein